MVGVAVPYSMASGLRRASRRVDDAARVLAAFLLVALGIFLRSDSAGIFTRFTFEDTLTQIGLGYGVLFLLVPQVTRPWDCVGLILAATGRRSALYPLPAGIRLGRGQAAAARLVVHTIRASRPALEQEARNLAWAFDTCS